MATILSSETSEVTDSSSEDEFEKLVKNASQEQAMRIRASIGIWTELLPFLSAQESQLM